MEPQLIVQGDAASCVIKKLQESYVAREQAKTREKLDVITTRIQNTLLDYDDTLSGPSHNMEILADVEELEALLKDSIMKNKYKQKLMIFIVGYENVCLRRVDLLSQLTEFFSTYGMPASPADQKLALTDSDVDMLNTSIQDALHSMTDTVNRLNGISSEILSCMDQLQTAASSKTTKSKKKLEKALHNAKEEVSKMADKVLKFQQEMGMKEERNQQLSAQNEARKVEIAHIKRQIDATKKSSENIQHDLKQERNALQLEVENKNIEIKMLEDKLKAPETSVAAVNPKLQEIKDTALVELNRLKSRMDTERMEVPEVKQELAEQFQVQMQQMNDVYNEEMEIWTQECRVNVHDILEIEMSEDEAQQWTQDRVGGSLPVSRMSDKDKPPSPYHTSSVNTEIKPSTAESEVRPLNRKVDSDQDLLDEEYWHQGRGRTKIESTLPADALKDSFDEYRRKARQDISGLTEKLQAANMIKENLANEATKWQSERANLLAHIEQLKLLQEEAEADAEEAMRNLEEFAAESEHIQTSHYGSNVGPDGDGPMRESPVTDHEPEPLSFTEDNVQKMGDQFGGGGSSPSSFSKPPSASTSRLASAYRQKIAERRDAIQKRRRIASGGSSVASPQMNKGTFDVGLLEEFLRCYRAVIEFKDMVSQEMSRHASHQPKAHAINAVPTSNYNASNDEVQLHVSSMSLSVEQALKVIHENVADALLDVRSSHGNGEAEILRAQIAKLQEELAELRADFDKRAQHDSAMIMHLQNTLSETQRGTTAAIPASGSGFPSSPAGPLLGKTPLSSRGREFTGDSSLTVMFSRLDAEHNARELKKSAAVGRITQETLESVVMTMDSYNAIPAKRIGHLASKLMHHTKMKVIETNVRNSNLVTSEVFSVLEKMESLQRRRAQGWSRQMDSLTAERRRLAALLTDALQRLETLTGVFLIKPVLSFKGKPHSKRYSGKISTRFNRHQVEAMVQKMQLKKSTAPQLPYSMMQANANKSSTSQPRAFHNEQPSRLVSTLAAQQRQNTEPLHVSGALNRNDVGLWNVKSSVSKSAPTAQDFSVPTHSQHPLSIPKIMELDIGRYQIETSNVYSFIPVADRDALGSDRIRNMEVMKTRMRTNATRSGLNLATGKVPSISAESATSGKYFGFISTAPPTSPAQYLKLAAEDDLDPSTENDELQLPLSVSVVTSPVPKPLPPIVRSSTRSSMSSGSPDKGNTPRSFVLTPARSMPDMTAVFAQGVSPPISARKDMATSPASNS